MRVPIGAYMYAMKDPLIPFSRVNGELLFEALECSWSSIKGCNNRLFHGAITNEKSMPVSIAFIALPTKKPEA
jgi:hypothetical protein